MIAIFILAKLRPNSPVHNLQSQLSMRRIIPLLLVLVACTKENKITKAVEILSEPDTAYATGRVRDVDKSRYMIVISHGPIRNLMPPMTMPYKTLNDKFLTSVHSGDSVRFRLTEQQSGEYKISEIYRVAEHSAPVP